jgi:Uma2 family endonuclease
MWVPRTLPRFTFDEFLDFNESASTRHEFLDGIVYAMAGGTPDHGTTIANITAIIVPQLRVSRCRPYSSDVMVSHSRKAVDQKIGFYPDFSASCEPPVYYRNVLLNPKLIVEVLSEKTEDYDRSEKFENYKMIESFTDYLLVDYRARRIEHFTKDEDVWRPHRYQGLDEIVRIDSMHLTIKLGELYDF